VTPTTRPPLWGPFVLLLFKNWISHESLPYCQGIRRIRIGIPGNSANIRRGILWYSRYYFRNSDFCPLVTRVCWEFHGLSIILKHFIFWGILNQGLKIVEFSLFQIYKNPKFGTMNLSIQKKNSFICKVIFFFRQIFFLYLGKVNFGGEKIYLAKKKLPIITAR
jgi:hypothetical protein